jgi:hypothetical protein
MKDRLPSSGRDLATILLAGAALWLFLVLGRIAVDSLELRSAPHSGWMSSGSIGSSLALLAVCMIFAAALRLIHWKQKPASRADALAIGGLLALVPLAVTFARIDSGVTSASIHSALVILGAIGASLLMYELSVADTGRDSPNIR